MGEAQLVVSDGTVYLLTFVAAVAGIGIITFVVMRAMRTGEFFYRQQLVHRDQHPNAYRFFVSFSIACGALMAGMGVYAIWRWVAGT